MNEQNIEKDVVETKKKSKKGLTIFLFIVLGILVIGGSCFGGAFFGAKYFELENKEEVKKEDKKEKTDDSSEDDEVKEETAVVDDKKEYKDFTKQEKCAFNSDEMCTYKYTFEKQANYVSKVDPDDLFIYGYGYNYGAYMYILNEGDVYYFVKYFEDETQPLPEIVKDDFLETRFRPEWKKVNLDEKVKRIKGINVGTGVDKSEMFITESGKVYIDGYNLNLIEELSEYNVDDVLDYNDEWSLTYKVVLKDGTILTKTRLSK